MTYVLLTSVLLNFWTQYGKFLLEEKTLIYNYGDFFSIPGLSELFIDKLVTHAMVNLGSISLKASKKLSDTFMPFQFNIMIMKTIIITYL